MSKTAMQDNELRQVSGGRRRPRDGREKCPFCDAIYDYSDPYPNGFRYKVTESGCSTEIVYKCPVCRHEWDR